VTLPETGSGWWNGASDEMVIPLFILLAATLGLAALGLRRRPAA
jgi:hypothetical protein